MIDRKINQIIIHCAATPEGRDLDVKDIDKMHKQRGWSGVGYHFVITIDGLIQVGRDLSVVGAHAKGYNSNSIGVCYIGGVDKDLKPKDTRTVKQKKALELLLMTLKSMFPDAEILGHKDLPNVAKACPSFEVKPEYGWM